MGDSPLSKTKADYAELIERLNSADSPVGIDAQLTHAIIIDFLQQIDQRLQRIEAVIATDDRF